MFQLRSVEEKDIDSLYELSKLALFLNLPSDKGLIASKIQSSLQAFNNPFHDLNKNYYIFVLEEISTNKIVGVSMIHAQHGTDDEPHFFLKVSQKEKHSETIQKSFTYKTLKLGIDTDGPTEIGGLILAPSFRGNPHKLGKQLSYIRFLYMAQNPLEFKDTIHCELMPPFNEDKTAPLWESLGRKFMKMDYHKADKLSRTNKEFILNLFPNENIYQELLPQKAQDSIGLVGKDTMPVKRMLERIGFNYTHEVDPFDGGPHYRAKLKDISIVREMFLRRIKAGKKEDFDKVALIEFKNKKHDFFALKLECQIDEQYVYIDNDVLEGLSLEHDFVSGIPF